MKKLLDKQKKSETISKDESPSKKHSSPILYDAVTWIGLIVLVFLVFKCGPSGNVNPYKSY